MSNYNNELQTDIIKSSTENSSSDESEADETCTFISSLTKRSDKQTRNEYCDIPLHQFLTMKCNSNLCPYGGRCVNETTIGDLEALRKKMWGGLTVEAPTAKQRKHFIIEVLQASYNKAENKFQFIAGGNAGNYHLVCEAAYMILLGVSKNRNASDCSWQWKNAKKAILGFIPEKVSTKLNKHSKLDSANTYIEYITSKLADTSPFANQEKDLIIPYYDIKTVYHDYQRYQINTNKKSDTVSLSTFRRAFESQKHIKLLGSKGSFHTCEICNNALDLLHDESKDYFCF